MKNLCEVLSVFPEKRMCVPLGNFEVLVEEVEHKLKHDRKIGWKYLLTLDEFNSLNQVDFILPY